MSLVISDLDDETYGRLRDLVQTHSGLYFPDKKRRDLEIALTKALKEAPEPFNTPNHYCHFLCHTPQTPLAQAELRRFINLLAIKETHFFRDKAQFDALTLDVLPALIAHKRQIATAVNPQSPPQLRIWSAGCATGEEAYSIAMLLRELIPDIDGWRILILATDINDDWLQQAKTAVYADWSFRENQAQQWRARYFDITAVGYQLQPHIRQMVTFAQHNLIRDPFPDIGNNTTSMDLIICRNVTIYFAAESTRQLVHQFYDCLVDGGWLVVGHSEPSLSTYKAFTGHILQGTLLYQKPKQRPSPLLTAPPVCPTVVDPTVALEQAQQLLHNGRTEAAIDQLQAIPHPHQNAQIYCLLAQAYADLGQWQQARTACQQAIDLDPLRAEVYYVLAMIEEHEGYLEPAIENWRKVLYLDNQRPLAYFNLAMLYKKSSQTALACRALKTFIQQTENWPTHPNLPTIDYTHPQQLSQTAQQLLQKWQLESRK